MSGAADSDAIKESIVNLAIKPNYLHTWETCGICGQIGVPLRRPYEIFLADNWQPVCERCAHEHGPNLVDMLEEWYEHHEVELPKQAVHGDVDELAIPYIWDEWDYSR